MHSFTSSSKYSFIIKCLIICGIILIVYTSIVLLIPKNLQGGNQWQTNIIKAQSFAFLDEKWDMTIVGSSMSYNIPVEKVSENAFNLGFAGGCSNTGLEILLQSQINDNNVIFIEMNETLMRGVDSKVLNKIKLYYENLPFLQEINRPDVVFIQMLKTIKTKTTDNDKHYLQDRDEPISGELIRQQKAAANIINEEELEKNIDELEKNIMSLREKGIKVILIEPPMHPSLFESKRTIQVRNSLRNRFPVNEWLWFDVDWHEYKTRDGIHLDVNSAKRYAEKMVAYREKVMSE